MKISIGKSRKDIHWKVQDLSWAEICTKLSDTVRTHETVRDYKAMNKDEQALIKDVGGFVGGVIVNGRRTKANVTSRSLITLDADFANPEILESCDMLIDYAMFCYSTHKHTPKAPRLRFVIPLDREVSPEEYEPIARMVASDIGIDIFDVTTYETSRLMYWPSTSSDGEFIAHKFDGEFLSANATLARYENWRDTTEWPLAENETVIRAKEAKAQGDPETKPGLVGSFCRAYDIPTAIETFLPEVYTPCEDGRRYTYTQGSTSAGVVLYENGKFAYSHHGTDPAGGQLCNSFDLVRLHKFGVQDLNSSKDTPVNKLPSYKAMCEFVQNEPGVKRAIVMDGLAAAREAFPAEEDADVDWAEKLQFNKQGTPETTTDNVVLILENDDSFKGKLATNIFTNRPCFIDDLPWRECDDKVNGTQWSDADDASLRHYIEKRYFIANNGKIADALMEVMQRHAFHPVRKYLESLKWDGIPRGEKLFIHYLGADDNLYTRTVTKKWLTAAVARVMRPGIKFDNLVVLVGAQGIGKSYLGNMLGRGWFSDTFTTVQGKDAYEQLKGSWIIEIGELSAMKKSDVESVKMFISKREDNYRAAYGRFAQVNKRQCVFYGTTNDDSFLRDRTGNRRFWPIGVHKENALYDVFELDDNTMGQIWAEAVMWFRSGESLYLDARVTSMAEEEQEKFMTMDPRQGLIEDYLDMPLPANWYDLDKTARRNYIQGFTKLDENQPTIQRTEVSVPEMAYELFGEEVVEPFKAKDYHSILTGLHNWKRNGARKRSLYGQQYIYERSKENADD